LKGRIEKRHSSDHGPKEKDRNVVRLGGGNSSLESSATGGEEMTTKERRLFQSDNEGKQVPGLLFGKGN